MPPEVIAAALLVIAAVLLDIWFEQREGRPRPIPRWDGTPQAYPATIEARIDLFIRDPRLAAQLEEVYPS